MPLADTQGIGGSDGPLGREPRWKNYLQQDTNLEREGLPSKHEEPCIDGNAEDHRRGPRDGAKITSGRDASTASKMRGPKPEGEQLDRGTRTGSRSADVANRESEAPSPVCNGTEGRSGDDPGAIGSWELSTS
jgi:hypothetical protein